MFNQWIGVGHLTEDLEVKQLEGGSLIGSTSIAVTKKWTDKKSNEKKEETMFVDLNFFGKTAERAVKWLHKGSKVQIVGELKLEQWKDKETGGNRSKHAVTVGSYLMLDNKKPEAEKEAPETEENKK